jgi:rhodanese-related sulfurtransferase
MSAIRLVPIAAIAALACAGHAKEPFLPVSVEDAARLLGANDAVFVDANVPEVYAKHHLPGAHHLGDRPLASVLPASKDARLVFYCSGPR